MSSHRYAPLGQGLVELCAGAGKSVLLVAPFVKVGTLERLLEPVPSSVPVRCITRWIPEEIIAGVSDLEVWPFLQGRGNATLALRGNLHAKYYRADDECLVGSANLTHAALGWRARANLELLLPMSAANPMLEAFERELAYATEMTEDLYREYVRAVREIRALAQPPLVAEELYVSEVEPETEGGDSTDATDDLDRWLPVLRHPEHLFDAYTGKLEKLTTASRADALRDLRAFSIPRGLSRKAFGEHVRLQLLQMPVIRGVDEFVSESQRFGAVRDYLASRSCATLPGFDSSLAWQTLMRWLLHFAGDRYVSWQANYSEIFWRRTP